MPTHYLYNPINVPNHVQATNDHHVNRENNYYRTNYGHQNAKVIRNSNVQLSWRQGQLNAPRFATKWGQAFQRLNVNMGARGSSFIGDFDPANVQKISARRHTKWYKFGAKSGPLKIVGDNDILNVNGHGNATGWGLSYKVDYRNRWDYYSISFTTLANLLKADGLPQGHRWIRLALCFGGGVENESQLIPAFAQKLAIALNDLGYNRIVVGGYTGATMAQNQVVTLNTDGLTLDIGGDDRARHIRWYDHHGMVTAGP